MKIWRTLILNALPVKLILMKLVFLRANMWNWTSHDFFSVIRKYLKLEATGDLISYKGEVIGDYVLRASNTNNYPAWENFNGYYLFRKRSKWMVGPYLGSNVALVLINYDSKSNSPLSLTKRWKYYDFRIKTKGFHNVEKFKITAHYTGTWKIKYCSVNLQYFFW